MVFPVNEICEPIESFEPVKPIRNSMNASNGKCNKKELIQKVRKLLDEMDTLNVEVRCCCTDPKSPPEGTKVLTSACLDGSDGIMKLVPGSTKERYIWAPPPMDTRPMLDPSDACYAPTMAKQRYECDIGLSSGGPSPWPQIGQPPRNGLAPQGPAARWSSDNTKGVQVGFASSSPPQDVPHTYGGTQSGGCNCNGFGASPQHGTNRNTQPLQKHQHHQGTSAQDYCEDSSFVPPKPEGHQIWTNEPGTGTCRYPEYCKASCFDHPPMQDWARHSHN